MTTESQLLDALQRMKFLQADAQRIHDTVVGQGFRTEEQDAEVEMMCTIADEIKALVEKITSPVVETLTFYRCRHCGKPTHRDSGMWLHNNSEDFARCGKVGIPRGTGEV
jgi:hypothetical protein